MPETDTTIHTSVNDLQARLADRDRLVSELTRRLEMAAEQLDRLKRSGADRGGRAVGGVPQELVDEQRSLTEELHLAVQQWVEMDPAALLGRMEIQVAEVRDLIVNRTAPADSPGPPAGSLPDASELADADADDGGEKSGAGTGGDSSDRRPPSKPVEPLAASSTYEAFKAGLMGSEPPPPPASAEPAATADEAAPLDDAQEASRETVAAKPAPEIPAVDPPEPIDVHAADVDALREAVDKRDSYIAFLVRKLRAAELAGRPSGSWHELENVPDELAERLKSYEKQLQELLRTAEVETSLERARLGRESNRLALLEQMLNKRMERLGLADDGKPNKPRSNGEAETQHTPDNDDSRKKRRGLFGLFRNDDE